MQVSLSTISSKGLRKALCGAALLVLAATGLYLLQRLVMPKYMHNPIEGAMIEEYYDTAMDYDVVFIGDCEVYENFSPVSMWDAYGIHSYIRGSAQQLIWQSYYLTEETLALTQPKAVVFNILSMKYDEPQNEAYNRMTLDGMRWSRAKINSIRASMMPEEHFIEYVFPLLRYHSRIGALEQDDFDYYFRKNKVTHEGYYMRVDSLPAENVPEGRPLGDYTFGDNAYAYLDRMRELCAKKGVELILIKAPTLYPYWYDEWEQQMEEYAAKYDLAYYNFLEEADAVGLDFQVDTYDAGLHLNLSGAEKMGAYFAKILHEQHAIPDRRGERAYDEHWERVREGYEAERDAQLAALQEEEEP